MNRRGFVGFLGSAATAWPLRARAQQTGMPVIGFLSTLSPSNMAANAMKEFHQGLKEVGFVEGRECMQQALIALLLLLATAGLATAQDASNKIPVIGWLSPATLQSYSQPGPDNPGPHQLRDALSKHGLIDGKSIRIDMRLAEGKLDTLPELAETVVREGATAILAFGEAAGRAAAAATKTVPIVCVADDLVDSGLGVSLARPGSNVTGVSILATELDAKKIELLKELLPGVFGSL
jgi:ABC-type uncharacterized transport system substrate-binding protein